MPPAAGRAVATGRPLEIQVFPLNLASETTSGGHARATTADGLVSDTACRTDRSPAKSGGPDRHSSQRCVVGSQHLLTKRCVVGPQLIMADSSLVVFRVRPLSSFIGCVGFSTFAARHRPSPFLHST